MGFAPRGQIQVVDPSTVRRSGYATISGVPFNYLERQPSGSIKARRLVFEPGAFADWLRANSGQPLPIYWSHRDESHQIGETTTLIEDSQGLRYDGDAIATTEAIEALTAMAGRSRTGASLHVDFEDPTKDRAGLEHIELVRNVWEVGPCPVGANPAAYTIMTERADAAQETQQPEPAAAATDAAIAATIYRAAARLSRRF